MLKKTPLFEIHRGHGARLVEFGGWEMPVQYTSIVDEHQTVRRAAGLFDIAHMGEVEVRGDGAGSFLDYLLTNRASRLRPGEGQYTLMCNEKGGVIDDLYAYRLEEERFLLVVNASRIDADVAWIQTQIQCAKFQGEAEMSNLSDSWGAVALQGPAASSFIDSPFASDTLLNPLRGATSPSMLKKNEIERYHFRGTEVFIGRTGYTGEDGFEIIGRNEILASLWTALMDAGKPFGARPAGLGARDTLRTEMGYPLYGHELDENTTPLEAGLGFFVDFSKADFIGRLALEAAKNRGLEKKLVAFQMTGKSAPPRPHYPILNPADGARIGEAVSGTQSPSLGAGIGMGYVPPGFAKPGTVIDIEIRGQKTPAVVKKKPLYQKAS